MATVTCPHLHHDSCKSVAGRNHIPHDRRHPRKSTRYSVDKSVVWCETLCWLDLRGSTSLDNQL